MLSVPIQRSCIARSWRSATLEGGPARGGEESGKYILLELSSSSVSSYHSTIACRYSSMIGCLGVTAMKAWKKSRGFEAVGCSLPSTQRTKVLVLEIMVLLSI